MTVATESRSARAAKERAVVELARREISVFARYCFGLSNTKFHKYMQAMADTHRKVTYDAPIESGKSGQFALIRPLFELGRDNFALEALCSSTPELPRRQLKVIRQHIEENERLRRVFPMRLVESTKNSITIERKRSTLKDASIVAMGIEGNILGRRLTHLFTDDILRFATTYSETERKKIWNRLVRELLGRLMADGRHVDIGTPWVASDARHKLRRMPGYVFVRFDGWTGEATDVNGKLITVFNGGLWPETVTDKVTGRVFGWPRERLEKARREMPGHEFSRQIRCLALSDAMDLFGSHLEQCKRLGAGIILKEEKVSKGRVKVAYRMPEPNWKTVFTGVDLAIDKSSSAHDTAFYTGAPEGTRKHLLEIRRGKIEGPDIIRNMIDIVKRYPLHRGFLVESNQGQKYILNFAEEPGLLEHLGATPEEAARITVYPHFTNKNKNDASIGVRSMCVDFEQRRWPIPCDEDLACVDLVQQWVDGLRTFDPINHCDDVVIASWLFAEMCRKLGVGGSQWQKFGIFVP